MRFSGTWARGLLALLRKRLACLALEEGQMATSGLGKHALQAAAARRPEPASVPNVRERRRSAPEPQLGRPEHELVAQPVENVASLQRALEKSLKVDARVSR